MDIYVTNGTNIGRVITAVWNGTAVALVVQRMDNNTVIAVPLSSATVVQVCIECHYRAKQTAPDGSIISDLCSVDQAAKQAMLAQIGVPTVSGVFDANAEREAAMRQLAREAAAQSQPVTQAQFSELVQLMRQFAPVDASAKAVE